MNNMEKKRKAETAIKANSVEVLSIEGNHFNIDNSFENQN